MATFILSVNYEDQDLKVYTVEADNLKQATLKALRQYLTHDGLGPHATSVTGLFSRKTAEQIALVLPYVFERKDIEETNISEGVVNITPTSNYCVYDIDEQFKIKDPLLLDHGYLYKEFFEFYADEEEAHPHFTAVEVWKGVESLFETA